jgi:hypothetical protein
MLFLAHSHFSGPETAPITILLRVVGCITVNQKVRKF